MENAFFKYVSRNVCKFKETDQDLKDIEQHVMKLVKMLLNKVTENDSFFKTKEKLIASSRIPVVVPTDYGELRTKHVKYHKLFLEYIQKQQLYSESDEHTTQSQDTVQSVGLVARYEVEIGVDLMLAFKHPSSEDILKNDGFPKEYKKLLLDKGCHLVAKSCHQTKTNHSPSSYGSDIHHTCRCDCWFISFAAMETEKMKDLNEAHKNCYKILKAILIGSVNYPGKCMNLSSYMLKNALLYHVHRDKCTVKSFVSCIPRILDYLRTGVQNVDMPCFFARDLNVWGKVVIAPVLAKLSCFSEQEPAVHSMLWVEFWRRVVLVFKDLLLRQEDQDQWVRTSDKIDCLRTLITFMLKNITSPNKVEVFCWKAIQNCYLSSGASKWRTHFFKYVSRNVCKFKETDQDLKDIEQHVMKLVKMLLNKVTENDSFFKTKEVFPTGSFYEGTKIRSPDEFDFMVVLDPLAFAKSITLDSRCNTSPWFRNINVNNYSSTTKVIVTDTRRVRPPWSAEKEFWKEINSIIENTPVVVPTDYGELRTKHVKYHKLFLEYIQKQQLYSESDEHTTQSQDTVQSVGLVARYEVEIGVDLMLAFKHPSSEDILKNDGFPKEYKKLLLDKGCHLVAKSCHQTKTNHSPIVLWERYSPHMSL
ncbi:unnamed protein product [Mytilus coruscus]|uniref:Mab-21-like HhH/H2TH-like domain-containing protein n=1 Tax=Mytilus coruscus TaxID=42192 RepID=A0A6J8ENP1_MYTCO|nr:unnamed protein product [Mytilus coruscus]